jgi:hypothetical protein
LVCPDKHEGGFFVMVVDVRRDVGHDRVAEERVAVGQ